jgi:hypothetical protein
LIVIKIPHFFFLVLHFTFSKPVQRISSQTCSLNIDSETPDYKLSQISGEGCEFILELNVPTTHQAIYTEVFLNISFLGDTKGWITVEKETGSNIFTLFREYNNSLSDSKEENNYRMQTAKVGLQNSYNKLRIKKKTGGIVQIALSSKTLGCPSGSELINGACVCKSGYYQVTGITEYICFRCPIYCQTCTAASLKTCPLNSFYSQCKVIINFFP